MCVSLCVVVSDLLKIIFNYSLKVSQIYTIYFDHIYPHDLPPSHPCSSQAHVFAAVAINEALRPINTAHILIGMAPSWMGRGTTYPHSSRRETLPPSAAESQ